MDNNFKIILVRDDITTTLIVRSKNGGISPGTNDPILNTLDILGLEKVPYSELMPGYRQVKEDDPVIGQECSICQELYKIKEYKRSLNCNHFFHKRCIDKWLKSNPNCPICRKDINAKS